LHAGNDRANLVLKRRLEEDRIRFYNVDVLGLQAKSWNPGSQRPLDIAIHNADDEPTGGLIRVGEDYACHIEDRHQALVQHFERRLCAYARPKWAHWS
jgi:hypothetical protein